MNLIRFLSCVCFGVNKEVTKTDGCPASEPSDSFKRVHWDNGECEYGLWGGKVGGDEEDSFHGWRCKKCGHVVRSSHCSGHYGIGQ